MQTHSYRNNFQYPDDAQWRIGSGQNYDLIQQGQNRPTGWAAFFVLFDSNRNYSR